MDDRPMKPGANHLKLPTLRLGDFVERSSVVLSKRQTQCAVQDVRRDMVGMRHETNRHPSLNGFVGMNVPVNDIVYRADHQKR